MADEAQTIRNINWREVFPFTNLFRAFRIAVHPSKLILALILLLLLYFGGRTLDLIWPNDHLVQPTDPMYVQPQYETEQNPRGIFICFFTYEVKQVSAVAVNVLHGNLLGGNIQAIANFLVTGPAWLLTRHPVYFTLFTAWFLLVWSVFGGAIARIAAVHVARDEKISVRQALRFSSSKILSFIFAPLIPLLIVLFIAIVVAIGGLLFYIPWIGPIVAGLFFIFALVAGVVAALVLVGTIGGFNLMYPTIAVEGSDSFDAISRSFSYVFARPWRMLFYTLIAIIYGALTYLFVRFFILLALALTHAFVSWWLGDNTHAGRSFPMMWPAPDWSLPGGPMPMNLPPELADVFSDAGGRGRGLPHSPHYDALPWAESFAAGLISMWVYLLIGLLGAYAISFYFSVNTLIYFLMRREVDATDLDDVYIEDADDEFGEAAARPLDAPPVSPAPAPAVGTTSAPGGGVTGTAGSADHGAPRPYAPPTTDAPNTEPPGSSPDAPPANPPDRPQ